MDRIRDLLVHYIATGAYPYLEFTDLLDRVIIDPATPTTTTTGAIMAKKDNDPIIATSQQRQLAHELTEAKRHAKEWGEWGEKKKEQLRASVDDKTDITLVTEDGREVASINESDPKVTYDYKRYFEDHPDAKRVLEEDYANEPKTVVTVLCKWDEPQAPSEQ